MIREFAFADSFVCNPAYVVCVDFNGKVAYACLCKDRLVLSEVWLYNAVSAPEQPDWLSQPLPTPPYLNSREFISEESFVVPRSKEAFDVRWFRLNGEVQVLIYINDDLHATMLAGERTGCCRLAKKNGPLANHLCPVLELV